MRFALALATGMAVSSCASGVDLSTDSRHPSARIHRTSGQVLCGVHRVPLVTIKGWKTDGMVWSHPVGEAAIKFERDNPDRILSGYSRSKTKEYIVPTEITYCRRCQDGAGGNTSGFDASAGSNQAMQLTASKPAVYAWSVCRRERTLRGMHTGSRQLILCLVR